uniref:Cysteine rich secreted protein n=1 Tax=Riptortus pedestris TaxID=329032 RepID=R4WE16_RIPPE|nr:cysteine rich secreted protein [Riptortus pedestris]
MERSAACWMLLLCFFQLYSESYGKCSPDKQCRPGLKCCGDKYCCPVAYGKSCCYQIFGPPFCCHFYGLRQIIQRSTKSRPIYSS